MPETLLNRIASGDRHAVDACLQRYGGLVWTLARRFCSDADEVEDGVQEVFVDLWKYADRFDEDRGTEVAFVTTIARRRLIDRLRRQNRRPVLGGIEADVVDGRDSVPNEVGQREQAERIRALMMQLKPEERDVLNLAILQGQSQHQIANDLKMPLGTVKSHARRGMQRLKELSLVEEGRATV